MNAMRIIKAIDPGEFKAKIAGLSIFISQHALDHLSDAQRKLFDDAQLIGPLSKENPRSIGLQKNGRYAVFYRRKKGYLKIIINIKQDKLEIVTFMNTDTMPNIK